MNIKPQTNFIALSAVVIAMVLSLTAWNQSATPNTRAERDTIPKAREKKVRDLDEALEELDRGMLELDKELNSKNWEKVEEEVRESMKEFDGEKIKAELDKAMKEIDVQKINIEMQKALKEVDMVKVNAEVGKALKEINVAEIKAQVEASLAKVDMEKIKKEIEQIKTIDFSKIEADLKEMKPEIEKSMKEARESIEKAKVELTEFKTFVDGLDKDGLINKTQNYSIKHEDGVLKIGGKVQPAEVYNKYKTFLEKHKDFTMKKDADDFNIDID